MKSLLSGQHFLLSKGPLRTSNSHALVPAKSDIVCSLANYSVSYEVTQSNRVSDFHDFVCSLSMFFVDTAQKPCRFFLGMFFSP